MICPDYRQHELQRVEQRYFVFGYQQKIDAVVLNRENKRNPGKTALFLEIQLKEEIFII